MMDRKEFLAEWEKLERLPKREKDVKKLSLLERFERARGG
jgi:hypothetical protein